MPADHEDMPYAKGGGYLTIDFLESCWTREKIENGLESLAKLRGTHAALILISYQVIHIANSVMIFYSRSDQPRGYLHWLHVADRWENLRSTPLSGSTTPTHPDQG